jgi:hypothetical protein
LSEQLGSTLPDELADLGYRVIPTGEAARAGARDVSAATKSGLCHVTD